MAFTIRDLEREINWRARRSQIFFSD